MAYQFLVSIEGVNQGKFNIGSRGLAGIKFQYDVDVPVDAPSGHAGGRRRHSPVKLTKEWDGATPQIFKALVTNEALPSVVFQFVKVAEEGKEEVYMKMRLINARVSHIKHYYDITNLPGEDDPFSAHELEDVSFTFQAIEVENVEAGTSAADQWSAVHE